MQKIAIFVGAVTLLVGLLGLVAPVSISPGRLPVDCGSPLSPDMSQATQANDGELAEAVVTDIDFVHLCRMELNDRRALTITVAAGGVFILAVAAGVSALSRSRQRTG